eukprot:TRINITY_DN59541_c0_g1_i1.p1 TRINITY_DN59541_c0_g1~~TRINITY_DN59541_c0_g1_i1.p1  ORF type:complete len:278 (-),score=16.52 TRINITY_DN59541_c0_g1_i1:192-1025(-)
MCVLCFFFFSSRRRHTRCREVSWARRCVQETDMGQKLLERLSKVVMSQVQSIQLYILFLQRIGIDLKTEITGLFKLIINTLLKEFDELIKNNVKLKLIGSKKNLDNSFVDQIEKACARSSENTGLTVLIAINYGSRREILDAVEQIVEDRISGKITKPDITEDIFSSYLYTAGVPDPELLIRTSGEMRLSNYLLWQNAYTELWFTDELWPDFNKELLMQAVIDYQNRDRRFGAVQWNYSSEQLFRQFPYLFYQQYITSVEPLCQYSQDQLVLLLCGK